MSAGKGAGSPSCYRGSEQALEPGVAPAFLAVVASSWWGAGGHVGGVALESGDPPVAQGCNVLWGRIPDKATWSLFLQHSQGFPKPVKGL